MAKQSKRLSNLIRRGEKDGIFPKAECLEFYENEARQLTIEQVQYTKTVSPKFRTRKETIVEANCDRYIRKFKEERKDIQADLYVATGTSNEKQNHLYLQKIHCHVNCQERLDEEIKEMRKDITNMERELVRLDKDNLTFKIKIQKTALTTAKIEKERRILENLKNELTVNKHREATYAASNAKLRERLNVLLNERSIFNDNYTLLMQTLNSGVKYFTEVQEYASHVLENCTMSHQRYEAMQTSQKHQFEVRKHEIEQQLNADRAEAYYTTFLKCKGKRRKWAKLEPKEVRRREQFREDHNEKIELYKEIMKKVLDITNSQNVNHALMKYREQEGVYYSFFTYSNELGYHITLLNNAVGILNERVRMLRAANENTKDGQFNMIEQLGTMLMEKKEKNKVLTEKRNKIDKRIDNICKFFDYLITLTGCNISSLQELLGKNKVVSVVNVQNMLKKLQDRLVEVIAIQRYYPRASRISEAMALQLSPPTQACMHCTPLQNIVLAQQCAECAEGEAVNVEGNTVADLLSRREVKVALYEKVTQPELQYRLHSLSQCRLPRSRMLAAKQLL